MTIPPTPSLRGSLLRADEAIHFILKILENAEFAESLKDSSDSIEFTKIYFIDCHDSALQNLAMTKERLDCHESQNDSRNDETMANRHKRHIFSQ